MPLEVQNDHPIPDRVRAQLLALGVSADRHNRDGLVGLFPGDFNIGDTSLDAADLARVLIHFTEKKVITTRTAAVPTCVRKVEPGWHFCQFYRDFTQLVEMIAPYIAEGLNNDEACLWVLPEVVTRKTVHDALGRHLDDLESRVASGQLEILWHRSWYLDPFGKLKSFEEISRALLERQNLALERGFKFLRAAGDAGWVSGTEQSRHFIDYEKKVNAVIGGTKVAAICTYRADVTADELVAIVTAHQDAFTQPEPLATPA